MAVAEQLPCLQAMPHTTECGAVTVFRLGVAPWGYLEQESSPDSSSLRPDLHINT